MRRILFLACFCPSVLVAQSTFVPLNEAYYHTVDRYEVKSGQLSPHIFTGMKPYKRSDIVAFTDSANRAGLFTSPSDRFNLEYLQNDNWEWARPETSDSRKPILKHFYKKKSDFLFVDEDPDFDLHVNPVLYVGAGSDSQSDDLLFVNTRGAELRGMLDRKLGFYMFVAENQVRLPAYISRTVTRNPALGYYPVLPHEGYWKPFKGNQGYDFFHTRGYISFEATRHLNLQFGHDRFFIGNGQRSLILSDNAPPALFLKGNAKVWKLNYMFLINRMYGDVNRVAAGSSKRGRYPDKYVAFHQLSVNLGKKLNVSLFESVVFNSTDSSTFELSYLNPVIFYRAIEHQAGSLDNVMLGADFKWNAFKGVSVYGQFVLDEFLFKHIKERNGWWANKWALQLGVKYIDAFGVSNLDLQGEMNIVRPYTYSHYTQYGSYSHYLQPLAHPLGANFREAIGVVRYQPLPRLSLTGKMFVIQVGRDNVQNVSWGSDIIKNYTLRERDFNNTIAQGNRNNIMMMNVTASWQLKHNVFIDATATIRNSESAVDAYNYNSTITSLALRWNIAQRLYEF
ncbi:MAG: hypothetical protein KF845_06350 [Cyclobacteriaceae bacterium]|nr:hypothetical protein [Cyclobacteriaceae bacterium]